MWHAFAQNECTYLMVSLTNLSLHLINSFVDDACLQYIHCTDEDQSSETARLSAVSIYLIGGDVCQKSNCFTMANTFSEERLWRFSLHQRKKSCIAGFELVAVAPSNKIHGS